MNNRVTDKLSFEELEYKYRADTVQLGAFLELMAGLPATRRLKAASWDIYYTHSSSEDSFLRLRLDPHKPELTKKVKKAVTNNWARLESDLPLDPARISEEVAAFHVGLDGYSENFRIFKYCDIHYMPDINYVFYIVYDKDMRESGRFIEVEVNKGRVLELDSISPGGSLEALRQGELRLSALGITPQHRLRKSLYELYRR